MALNDPDTLEQLVRTLDLSDRQENELLRDDNDDRDDVTRREAATVTVVDVEVKGDDGGDWADAVADGDGTVACKPDLDRAVLMDVQLVYHRGRGTLIKEMALKGVNWGPVCNVNMRHDVTDVPAHLVVKQDSDRGETRHYHPLTGLDLRTGDMDYDDRTIAQTLEGASVVFMKGANKKAALVGVFERLQNPFTENGGDTTLATTQTRLVRPTIVNIDGYTADDEDRTFCRKNNIALATFSFTFVYKNVNAYLDTLMDSYTAIDPTDIVHINNVLAGDTRYNVCGRGRVVCICHSDHSRGGSVKTFGTRQRCALLNLSMLYYLWYGGRYEAFVTAVRSKDNRGGRTTTRDRRRRPRHRPSRSRGNPPDIARRPRNPVPRYIYGRTDRRRIRSHSPRPEHRQRDIEYDDGRGFRPHSPRPEHRHRDIEYDDGWGYEYYDPNRATMEWR